MTRFSKPALLAGGLAAALLLSTGLASAAPGHDGYDRHDSHAQSRHDGNGYGRDRARSRDASHRDFGRNFDRRDDHRDFNRHFERDRDGRSFFHADYDHARYRGAYRRPPLRIEYRGYAPRHGMYWRAGEWRWQDGQWVWFVGTWLMAAQAFSH